MWSRNNILVNAAHSLLVRQTAVAISSCRRRAFMHSSKLMYRWGTCLEEEEWQEGNVVGV
jgi:hypothetical protein